MNQTEIKQEQQSHVEYFPFLPISSATRNNEESKITSSSESESSSPNSSNSDSKPSNSPSQSLNKGPKRLSASKKYWGQIMVGIGHFGLRELQNSASPLDTALKNRLHRHFTGKKGMEYKLCSQKKVLKIVIVDPKDSFEERQLKLALSQIILRFFQDINYENWALKEFKGTEENKIWYLVNKRAIMDRVLLGKKTHFSNPTSDQIISNRIGSEDFVTRDEIFENSKIKEENEV